jgi:uncharacterized delta-60 repeat protein
MSVISKLTTLSAAGAGEADVYWINLLYGGGGISRANGVAVDSSKNVIMSGRTDADGAGSTDFLIAKYDASGVLQWDRTLGGSGFEQSFDVALDSSNNIVVAGTTNSDGAGSNDALVAKYNSSGTLQWDKTLGDSGSQAGNSIAVDSSDNIYIGGSTPFNKGLLAKYNSSGTLQWDKEYGSSQTSIQSIAVDSSDNIIAIGYTNADGSGGNDLLIAKFNSSGALSWDKTLGGSGEEYGYGVAVDSSDNIYISAMTSSDGAGGFDALLAKYNSSGTLQWDRTLGDASTDRGLDVAIDSSNNVILVGATGGVPSWLIAKYNSSGTLQWQRTLGDSETNYANSVTTDSADNIIIGGYRVNGSDQEAMIVKLPPDGSGTGTYAGDIVYASSSLTDAAAVLTDATAVLSLSNAGLTSADAVLTDAAAVLTDLSYEVTP